MNNTILSNPIGRSYKCLFAIRDQATLRIGNNVGMSGTTIVCRKEIEIGNNVKIGGNVCIYDTDFHSLNPKERAHSENDKAGTKSKKLTIKNNVFIGAHSTILKGVTIGENSIVGAGSLVAKNIPANEIWGGNPAKFIKKV
ncbi:acyltransferase [Lutibacter sp.]